MALVYNGSARDVMVAGLVRAILFVLTATALALTSTGCVTVHAHQREDLAKRAMTNDRDTGESRFDEHAHGSREGAVGGTGQPGGGCGCN
jgi:hypothetical protein